MFNTNGEVIVISGPGDLNDLSRFHAGVEQGDEILVLKPTGAVHGIFTGLTSGRFHFKEQCINLTEAVVIPPSVLKVPGNPSATLNFLHSVAEGRRGDRTFNLGQHDFVVVRRRPAPVAASL